MFQSIIWSGTAISLLLVVLLLNTTRADPLASLRRVKRIVGGRDPQNRDNYGYVASIQTMKDGKMSHICGGAHLGGGWVVTAAHCVFQKNWRNYYIRFGIDDLHSATMDNMFSVVDAKTKGFIPLIMANDIALLKVNLNGSVKDSIQLPSGNRRPSSGTTCEIGGFGAPYFLADISDSFKVAPIRTEPLMRCIQKLGFIILPSLTEAVVCAGGGKTDTCQGDSGASLVCNGKLVGITSYGRDCGIEGVPAIYTNVQYYAKWISSTINHT